MFELSDVVWHKKNHSIWRRVDAYKAGSNSVLLSESIYLYECKTEDWEKIPACLEKYARRRVVFPRFPWSDLSPCLGCDSFDKCY